ncbi:uncharacterized protein LOC128745760 [Sabethes cyaneus]|uniref:uncharacterized protein LOC128745760 n=1 Tax=Sabethes cyaneus TaxID=53552 RepID=UPI00237D3A3C|nr:uncharacterized protein LOC128745760 [Sabethes cyaneus]
MEAFDKDLFVEALRPHSEAQSCDADELTEALTRACDTTMPRKVEPRNRRRPVYWWNESLNVLRANCNRARRCFQRARGIETREERRSDLRVAKAALKYAIKQSKTNSFKELCRAVDSNPWGDAYRIVMARIRSPAMPAEGCPDKLKMTIKGLFPEHEPTSWPPTPYRALEDENADERRISNDELVTIAKDLKMKKAPGPHGIPNAVLKEAIHAFPDMFNTVMQNCLNDTFRTSGKSRRKLLERIILNRLSIYAEGEYGLTQRQFGFRKGWSTLDAIRTVVEIAQKASKQKRRGNRYCAVVTIDVKNALNSASWEATAAAFHRMRVPDYLCRVLRSYFTNRVLVYRTNPGKETTVITAGVPRGSILDPSLWNSMYDGVLTLELPTGVEIVGLADDIVMTVTCRSLEEVEALATQSICRVETSAESHGTAFSDHRNSFLSYEQKGLDVCPFTYFKESCSDFAHIVILKPSFNSMNSIVNVSDLHCLGTLIRENYVLTTASCVQSKNITVLANTAESITVDSVYLHPDYKLLSDQNTTENNLAILRLNTSLHFSNSIVASCLWDSESLHMYTKVQEIGFDKTTDRLDQNSTVCSGDSKNACLKSTLNLWCRRKSSTGILQIRELGKFKMHAMIASFGCNKDGNIVLISQYLPWIREVTKSTLIEYNLTDVGLGEKCFKNDGTMGVCLPTEQCPQVHKNFKSLWKNNSISTCGFENSDALTCCATDDMLVGPETDNLFRDIVQEIENCEVLYDEFRRTPEEYQINSQIAIISVNNSVSCTATLITTRYLITSAHCISGTDTTDFSVWLGVGDDMENVAQKNEIHSIYLHPKFNVKKSRFNVAIIMLKYPVLIQHFSVPACLWREKAKLPTNLEAISFKSGEKKLVSTFTSPMYYSDCRNLEYSNIIPSELCVKYKPQLECSTTDIADLCQTSGSGLYANLYHGDEMKPVMYLVGIYSQGYKCDKQGPAIYTRISEYYQWIKSIIYLSSQQKQ